MAVRKAIAAGRISIRRDGKIDSDLADREWASTTDATKPRNSVTGNPGHQRPQGGPKVPWGMESDPAPGRAVDPRVAELAHSFAANRAMRESIEVRIRKIELDRIEGKLVDADAVRALAFTAGRRARDMVLSLPDRLSGQIADRPVEEVHRIMTREVRLICEEIARAPVLPGEKG